MTIISLFDYTGNWSRSYRENGYDVIQIDIQLGQDILTWDYKNITDVYGILAAVPCTDFALSGSKWFGDKDIDGRTYKSNLLVKKTIEIINYFNPEFWVIENPMSRIHRLNPELGEVQYKFNPCDFAQYDPNPIDSQYNKETWLWGEFNNPIRKPLPALMTGQQWKDRKGVGSGVNRKNARSITPLGFAYAFYQANNTTIKTYKQLKFEFAEV